jgi:phage gp29-like protein
MLYDAFNRPIRPGRPPADGRLAHWEPSDRDSTDVSRSLTPAEVGCIMERAASGDQADQARLALEIEEKNWDIFQALQTRRLAVTGLEWTVEPSDPADANAVAIAEEAEAMLRATPPSDGGEARPVASALVEACMGALLPGFAVAELVWAEGGKRLEGVFPIPQRHFTFAGSELPLLVTRTAPAGVALPFGGGKFLYHRHRARSGDATRGGLVRPLAWLDIFQRLNFKDLLRFIERYGGPFLVAHVSQEAWEKDRSRLKQLVQNFGSDGGAVFTEGVQTELLQAANATGDVFFRLLEYCGAAIAKVVLGQTATSGDAAGFSKGQAQENVRLDLKVGDAGPVGGTVTANVLAPWTVWNYGPAAKAPVFRLQCDEPDDLKLASEVLVNLSNAGFEADEGEVSERFGYTLVRKAPPPPPPVQVAQAAPAAPSAKPAADVDDAEDGADSATLAGEGSPAPREGIAEAALGEFLAGDGLEEWFGPLRAAIDGALAGEPDEAEFRSRLAGLAAALPGVYERMDSSAFEDVLARALFTAAATGKADKAAELAERSGR